MHAPVLTIHVHCTVQIEINSNRNCSCQQPIIRHTSGNGFVNPRVTVQVDKNEGLGPAARAAGNYTSNGVMRTERALFKKGLIESMCLVSSARFTLGR